VQGIGGLAALLLAAGPPACTGDVDGGYNTPHFMAVEIAAPLLEAGTAAEWTAEITGGNAPYYIAWDFGEGAVPPAQTQTGLAGHTAHASVALPRGERTVVVQVTDQNGLIAMDMQSVAVPGEPPRVTVLAAAVQAGGSTLLLRVRVDNPGGDSVTVTPEPNAGYVSSPSFRALEGLGAHELEFTIGLSDIFGGSGPAMDLALRLDYAGRSESIGIGAADGAVLHQAWTGADTLIAVPLQPEAGLGQRVRVVVATAVPANPFHGCDITLTCPEDAQLVPGSFNVGAPGGETYNFDGIWAALQPAGGFLGMANPAPAFDAGDGRSGYTFSLRPSGGGGLTMAAGPLFSVEFQFFTPGIKRFGFLQADGAERTYYLDTAGHSYYWGDIANDGSIAPNSVTVN
jgi:hypothetical protein